MNYTVIICFAIVSFTLIVWIGLYFKNSKHFQIEKLHDHLCDTQNIIKKVEELKKDLK